MKFTKLFSTLLFSSLAFCTNVHAESRAAQAPQLISVEKIWESNRHSAFTDLIRYRNQWFCTFREGEHHVGGEDGTIRVLVSKDGSKWESAALLQETGVDLRDPKLSITPDNRLMLVIGGSVYEGKALKTRQPRVAFSKDGREWSTPEKVLDAGDWLWRVTWHKGKAYGLSYVSQAKEDWHLKLFESKDGVNYSLVKKLDVPGKPNEGTLRFSKNGEMIALVRREGDDKQAWIGKSKSPFTEWTWTPSGMQIGGPNFIFLPDGRMIASGREYHPKPTGARTFLGSMNLDSVTSQLTLPSGGDTSYPGLVFHKGLLWMSYYSSHEGKSSIYLAKIKIPKR